MTAAEFQLSTNCCLLTALDSRKLWEHFPRRHPNVKINQPTNRQPTHLRTTGRWPWRKAFHGKQNHLPSLCLDEAVLIKHSARRYIVRSWDSARLLTTLRISEINEWSFRKSKAPKGHIRVDQRLGSLEFQMASYMGETAHFHRVHLNHWAAFVSFSYWYITADSWHALFPKLSLYKYEHISHRYCYNDLFFETAPGTALYSLVRLWHRNKQGINLFQGSAVPSSQECSV